MRKFTEQKQATGYDDETSRLKAEEKRHLTPQNILTEQLTDIHPDFLSEFEALLKKHKHERSDGRQVAHIKNEDIQGILIRLDLPVDSFPNGYYVIRAYFDLLGWHTRYDGYQLHFLEKRRFDSVRKKIW